MNNSYTNQAEQLNETAVMQSVILPNELRIGSIISDIFSESTQPFTITKLLQNKCYYKPGSNAVYDCKYENLKPIPLTEEWLLKFGFQIDETYVSEQNPYLDYIKDEVRISMPYYSFEFGDGAFMELKYVHQLQNLYFSLTARELTVA